MLEKTIAWSLSHRWMVLLGAMLICIGGYFSLTMYNDSNGYYGGYLNNCDDRDDFDKD